MKDKLISFLSFLIILVLICSLILLLGIMLESLIEATVFANDSMHSSENNERIDTTMSIGSSTEVIVQFVDKQTPEICFKAKVQYEEYYVERCFKAVKKSKDTVLDDPSGTGLINVPRKTWELLED